MIARPTLTLLAHCLVGGAAAVPETKTVDGVDYGYLQSTDVDDFVGMKVLVNGAYRQPVSTTAEQDDAPNDR